MKSYVPDYPRPQLVRSGWTNLNGNWGFCFDDTNIGEEHGWSEGFTPMQTIVVPFTYETSKSGINDTSYHPVVWYQREIGLDKKEGDKQNILHFEGSDYHTKVWINGRFMGENYGGYSRFSLNISEALYVGENKIVVRIEDTKTAHQVRGKQRWIKDSFECWYIQSTGIWKTVWMETRPLACIDSMKMTPWVAEQKLHIEVKLSGDTKGMQLQAIADYDGIVAGQTTVVINDGCADILLDIRNTEIDPWGIKKWFPESPHLYDLEINLLDECRKVDTILSYFGMRSVAIQGKEVLLNGMPIYQKLILDQGYWEESHLTPPDEHALITDIDSIRQLGYNGLRKHQKTEDERFMYWCDIKGMLVWCEMPSPYVFNYDMVTNFTNEWLKIVRQNYNHPCIITWTPLNESWGVPDVSNNRAQQHFTEAIYHLTKSVDSMRPVVVNDGWESTISDIITLHDYQESGELLYQNYIDHIKDILDNNVAFGNNHFAFANGYKYKNQPIIISEFGGIRLSDGQGWGYGNRVYSEEEFITRFKSVTQAIQNLPFINGYCYTQVTDVQQELNGLMDVQRIFKVKPEKIAEINASRKQY